MSAITSLLGSTASLAADRITSVTGAAKSGGGDFGSTLKSAIQNVDQYQHDATHAIQDFLQGNGELHNVAIATQRAEMAFDLGMQVRNKVISAYQEIMKMQL